MNPQIEQRWAGHAIVAMGETQTPALLKEYAARLHAVKDIPAYEQATCPLPLLQCAVHMMDELHEKAQAGNAKLRELGQAGQMSAELPVAPQGMRELLDARLRDEQSPVPLWLGPPMQAANVVAAHGEPDADALEALGLGGLDKRLTALEEGNGQTHARAGFLQRYQPNNAVDNAIEAGAAETYGRLIRDAQRALDKLRAPAAWDEAPTVSRRLFGKIQLEQPALAMEMMTREKPVTVVDAA